MMTENADKKREQIHLLCMDEMVPKDHLLRIIDKAIDWHLFMTLFVILIRMAWDVRVLIR